MTISDELYKNTLENGVKRRMPITWGTFNCIEPIDAETVAAVIAASAEGNYFYTTRMPTADSDEDGSAIEVGRGGKLLIRPHEKWRGGIHLPTKSRTSRQKKNSLYSGKLQGYVHSNLG